MLTLDRIVSGVRRRIGLFLNGAPDTLSPEHAPKMVQLVFNGVLHRPPEPTALAAYTAAVASGQLKIDAMIDELMHLPEVQLRFKSERFSEPISAAYRVILVREPTPIELERSVKLIESGTSFTEFFQSLTRSSEAKRSSFRDLLADGGLADLVLASIEADRSLERRS